MPTRWLCAPLVALLFAGLMPGPRPIVAQEEPKKEEPKKEEPKKDDAKKEEAPTPKREVARPKGNIRPFDQVIPGSAKTTKGLFLVHRVEDKVFYEIPTDQLSKEMLWVTAIAKTQSGFGFGGSPVGNRVVRWEQRNDDILLREVKYAIRADADDPIKDAVASTSMEAIIEVFPIRAFGKDKAPVIEVTSLFTSDLPEFSARRRLNASGIDPRKSFIESVRSFPENIESKVLLTYRTQGGGRAFGPGGPTPVPTGIPTGGGGEGGAVTVELHHSMVKLPDEPMKPRKFDDRVGFFNVQFQDFGNIKNHQVEEVRYVTRWRLEKKDPAAEVSEPKKPIVFYIGREVPAKFRPFIKKGIEAWQPAFEAAGFKNAILAKEAPSPREDPDWDAEDARYSTIRWWPSTVENARGPHVSDPRTGEILEADIEMHHNVLKLARDWYFVQASPNDEKAQKLPLPDSLVGDLLAYVVTHEVGHSLGLQHNMKGSAGYTVEQLRSKEFTEKNGVEASIMDYGRFNYVAQPGDGARLIPIIGPYDRFAIEWGYKPFPKAKTYDEEKKELDAIASRQVKDPMLRFGPPNPSEDPSQQTEDLGSDPIAATTLGLKNIDRVAGYLVKATSNQGEDYDLLQNMYGQLVGQRNRELGHVANLVGGVVETNLHFGDGDHRFDPAPAAKQREAVTFLNANAFQVPAALIAPDILGRLEATGAADRILASQRSILRTLLGEDRVKRMAEVATRLGKDAYTPAQLVDDLHGGIFGELKDGTAEIDLYRRNLQRTYVDQLCGIVEGPRSASSDLPALARGELVKLLRELDGSDRREGSEMTRLHLADLKARIAQALDPNRKPAEPAGNRVTIGFPGRDD